MPLPQKKDSRTFLAWLTLNHVDGLHSRVFNRLLEIFSTPENILAQDCGSLTTAGLNNKVARNIAMIGRGCMPETVKASLDKCLLWLEDPGHHLLIRPSSQYPTLLTCIPDPPPLLYVKGDPACLGRPMIAIVGSRQPSAGGRRIARRFAQDLAANGVGVVSGLALGIDVESHRGAIEGGNKTVAALGTGIDKIYPAANRNMFDQVAEHGALISEFNPGTPPRPINFPQRNRIISGLSQGVLVVEAGLKSGSMITARFALEQGREVFAIPGSIYNPLARGCHKLIAEGAKLTQDVDDILEDKLVLTAVTNDVDEQVKANHRSDAKAEASLQTEEKKVFAAIGFDPVSLEALVLETGLEISLITAGLMELELKGLIHRESNGYVLTRS